MTQEINNELKAEIKRLFQDVNEAKSSPQDKRKDNKLKVLSNVLYWAIGLLFCISGLLFIFHGFEKTLESNAILVMVTILGSVITTIIGILGGTSID
ncbi:MAG: hypothetical protein K0U39_07625 [Alphaproteobacteria bacterium]|nr:hypothetical protein [Alphaproteobacteria bacterium]